MKILYLIRHAKSSWAEMGKTDFERQLDERGHRDAPRMAELLRGLGVKPDLLVSSTALRALTTAQYFADAFLINNDAIQKEKEIYEATESDVLHIVRGLPNDKNTVFMYGHNPTFTFFANRFSKDYIDNLPTCGIVKIELNADKWSDFNEKSARSAGFWYPKMLSK